MSKTYVAAALAGLLALSTGCVTDDSAAAKTPQSKTVTVTRPWVKAAKSGATTAAFGTLRNGGEAPVRITSATTDASTTVALHETVQGDDGGSTMRAMKNGLAIPAGRRHTLAPGGDHLMLMQLKRTIRPGDRVTLTLVFADGSRTTFTAPARAYSGAQESYAPDGHA